MGEMMDTSFLIKLLSRLSGILWLSLPRISALSATILFFALEQAGGAGQQTCQLCRLVLKKKDARPGRGLPPDLADSKASLKMCSITLHLLRKVLSPNFWLLSCQCGSNCKPFVPTNTELSEVRRQC